MDKATITNELVINLIDHTDLKADELKQIIADTIANYSVSKMQTTLPSTGDGSTSLYLFREFAKSKIAEGMQPNSLKAYERSVNTFYSFIKRELNLVTSNDIILFLDYYRLNGTKGERKPNTVRNMYLNLSAFYMWLFNNKYIGENIFATIKTPKGQVPNKKIVSQVEFNQMIDSCNDDKPLKHSRDIAILSFLNDSGIRVSEFVNLNVEDIDFDNHIIYVINGKGGKDRESAYSEATHRLLIEYLEQRTDVDIIDGKITANKGTPLFSTLYTSKSRMSTDAVRDVLKAMNDRVYPHLLRATCCTNLIQKGAAPTVVQSIMGHSSMDMTNRYTKIPQEELRGMMESLI